MKRHILGFILLAMFLGSTGVMAEEISTVSLDGAKIVENRTMVPIRSIFETLDAKVDWNEETQTVIATKGATKIILKVNSNNAEVNGEINRLLSNVGSRG